MSVLAAPITVPLLCGAMLILTLMRVAVPFGQAVIGEEIGSIPLRLRERVRMQRTNIYLIGVLLVLGTVGSWLRMPLNLIVVLATYVIVSIPVQYTLTAAGVARNRVVFRAWDEFVGMREEAGRILLIGKDGAANFPLLLAPEQHAAVRRLLVAAGVADVSATSQRQRPRVAVKRAKGGGRAR